MTQTRARDVSHHLFIVVDHVRDGLFEEVDLCCPFVLLQLLVVREYSESLSAGFDINVELATLFPQL